MIQNNSRNIININKAGLIILQIFILELFSSFFFPTEILNSKALVVLNITRLLEFFIVLYFVYKFGGNWKDLGLVSKNFKKDFLLAIYFIFCLGAVVLIFEIFSLFFFKNDLFLNFVDDSIPIKNLKFMLLYFFTVGFSACVIEELIFRYIIYNTLRSKFNMISSIIFTSFLFAFLHLDNFLIPLIGGILFAILYELTGNLMASILLHSAGNLTLLLITIIYKNWIIKG